MRMLGHTAAASVSLPHHGSTSEHQVHASTTDARAEGTHATVYTSLIQAVIDIAHNAPKDKVKGQRRAPWPQASCHKSEGGWRRGRRHLEVAAARPETQKAHLSAN